MKKALIVSILIAVAAVSAYVLQSGGQGDVGMSAEDPVPPDGALAAVTLPAAFSDQERIGARAYDAACAACHGVNAQGQDGVAPPLVHKIYEPGHHGDMSFVLAAQNGVRAHHWKFGDMPPVEGVTRSDVLAIIAYVRALQRANGIN
jgi:mono/diheme cytochrome c family protein